MKLEQFYDISKELPVEQPKEIIDKRLGIYKWGDDNLYPYYLAALRYNCALHGGIIQSKIHYTVSGGLRYEGVNKELFNKFMSNGNSDYDLNEVTQFLSSDLEDFNGYAYTVTFVNQQLYKINHVPFETLRYGTDGNWYGSDDWSDKKIPITEYTTLDTNNRAGSHLVVYLEPIKQVKFGKKVNKGVYPIPTYSGGILAIETDIEINNYRRNEIANNFSLGTIVNFNNGQPATEEDKKEIKDELRSSGQGSSNAGGVMAVFNNGKDNETTVTNLTGNNLDARYLALSKDNKENILLAHSVTSPILFGVKTEGQLGGATELETSYNLMREGYFKYRQKAITTTLNYIFNNLLFDEGKIDFNKVEIQLVKEEIQPTNQFNFNTQKGENDKVVDLFRMVGTPKEKVKLIHSKPLDVNNIDEERFVKEYKTFEKVTDIQIDVLSMVQQGKAFELISDELNISRSNLSKIYSNLESEGLLSNNEVTSDGLRVLASNDKIEVDVVYSYEVRPELGQPEIIPTTRDFCRSLIELDRVYSRFEINQISDIVGRDVWLYRGGWYHNPNTDKTTKSCRHYWQQNIVLK